MFQKRQAARTRSNCSERSEAISCRSSDYQAQEHCIVYNMNSFGLPCPVTEPGSSSDEDDQLYQSSQRSFNDPMCDQNSDNKHFVVPKIIYSEHDDEDTCGEMTCKSPHNRKDSNAASPKFRRPSTLKVQTSQNSNKSSNSDQSRSPKLSHSKSPTKGRKNDSHHRHISHHDEHDLKRRWLMYCVALDKSIMYANLIW